MKFPKSPKSQDRLRGSRRVNGWHDIPGCKDAKVCNTRERKFCTRQMQTSEQESRLHPKVNFDRCIMVKSEEVIFHFCFSFTLYSLSIRSWPVQCPLGCKQYSQLYSPSQPLLVWLGIPCSTGMLRETLLSKSPVRLTITTSIEWK